MSAMKHLLDNILDAANAKGEADATNHEALPTDAQLWEYARTLEHGQALGEDIDPERLEQLREAYNAGRKPSRFDMWEVTRAVKAAGQYAFVDHTGGNTATIYGGRAVVGDENRDLYWSVVAGPGVFEGAYWTKPFADTAEFWIGPDDDREEVTVMRELPEHTTAAEVAKVIVAVIEETEQRRKAAGVTYASREAVVEVHGEYLAGEVAAVYERGAQNAGAGAGAQPVGV